MSGQRPPVRIRFKYNVDTGEVEEFIVDDNAPAASEDYHDRVARVVSSRLVRDPELEDADAPRPEAPREVLPSAEEETRRDTEELSG